MKKRTTTISVRGETWRVPRGFGFAYRVTAQEGAPVSAVVDLLALVGYAATPAQVRGWNLRRRVEAIVHAGFEYARASDNPVRRHPRPRWLPKHPWQGSWRGKGAFAGPTGTSIE